MNTALDNALREKGISTDRQREDFARAVGVSGRSLRRWINENTVPTTTGIRRSVARRLNRKPGELWPNG